MALLFHLLVFVFACIFYIWVLMPWYNVLHFNKVVFNFNWKFCNDVNLQVSWGNCIKSILRTEASLTLPLSLAFFVYLSICLSVYLSMYIDAPGKILQEIMEFAEIYREKWLHRGSFMPRSTILLACDKFTSILIAEKSSKERLLRGDLKVLAQRENESCQSSCKHCFYSYVPCDSPLIHSLIQLCSDCHQKPLVVRRRDSTYRLQRLFGRNLDEMCQWWQIPIIKHNVFTWNRGMRLIEMQPRDNDGQHQAMANKNHK